MKKLSLLCGVLLAVSGASMYAQEGPPPPGSPGAQDHFRGRHERGLEGRPPGFLPPGTWWRKPDFVKLLGLTDDQRKRMDDAFLQSRPQLQDMHAALEKQEQSLEPILNAQPFDQARAQVAISGIADARAALEKVNAKMLISIRAVLTQDQWQKLRSTRIGPSPIGGAPNGKVGWAHTPGPM